MDEHSAWQRLLQDMFPGIIVTAAEGLRDWSQSQVIRLTARRDGTALRLFAKRDRSAGDREAAVCRAAARMRGFPAPRAGFVTGPDGAEWLVIGEARGTRLCDLPATDWVTACRALAAFHEQAAAENWAAGIAGLPALADRLPGLPWPVLDATRRCADVGQYTGIDQAALAGVADRLGESWPRIAAEIAGFPQTLVHGDSHSGNLFLDPGGSIELIDWAGAEIGPGLCDLIGLFDTAARMREHCPEAAALAAYRERLGPRSREQYGDFSRACDCLRVLRGLTELEWFAASGDDYGERANCEFEKIAASLDRLQQP